VTCRSQVLSDKDICPMKAEALAEYVRLFAQEKKTSEAYLNDSIAQIPGSIKELLCNPFLLNMLLMTLIGEEEEENEEEEGGSRL
jgi:hypothetical protein